jgi:type II secretory pathway pseudopilin PulG
MKAHRLNNLTPVGSQGGFTLVEVVLSTAIAALTIGSVIYGYLMSAKRAEWSSYSLAASSLAMQRLEQARSCKWDPMGFPPVDLLITNNFPMSIEILDVPRSGTNMVYATNFTTIKTISASPLVKMVRVDCVWSFLSRGPFTNTVATYRAPDQ